MRNFIFVIAVFALVACSGGDKRAQDRRQKFLRTLARVGGGNSAYCSARAKCDDGGWATCFAPAVEGRVAICGKEGTFLRCGADSFACCDKQGKAFVTSFESDAKQSCAHP